MSDGRRWPALVLAAGLGTRLGPLSALRAKAALPVAGRPLIVRILQQLRAAGVERVVINLHHRPETITRVVGDGGGFGLEVRYSWEPAVLGSGGGPARAIPLLAADRFFIVNGDTLSGVSLPALVQAHLATDAQATLAVATGDLAKYNALVGDAENAFVGIAPRGTAIAAPSSRTAWHFVGVQAVNASAFAGVDPTQPSDSLRDVYTPLVEARPASVRVFASGGRFHDIGTPADYLHTAMTLAREEAMPLDRGVNTTVAASARVQHSLLWDRVTIGDEAVLDHCIVTDDVVVPPGTRYDHAVITRAAVTPL
jgi:NDP-sugar pyrophosphorylase family protein